MANTDRLKFRFNILHKILLAMMLVALVPLSVIWYVDYRSTANTITAGIEQQLSDTSDKLVNQVNDWMTMNIKSLNFTAALPDIVAPDATLNRPILLQFTKDYPWNFLAHTVDAKGTDIARNDDKAPIEYADRIWFKVPMSGKPLGHQVLISRTTGQPALALGVPIYETGTATTTKNIIGVFAIAASIEDISNRITNIRIGNTGYAFLLDENGKVVAHQKKEFVTSSADFSKHAAFVNRPATGKASLTYQDDGREVIAYVQTTEEGWILITQQDHDEAFSPLRAANHRALAVLVVTLLIVTAVATTLASGLSRPIRNLTNVADELSRGRMVTNIAEMQRHDEIGALAVAIDRMGASIHMAIERLRSKAS